MAENAQNFPYPEWQSAYFAAVTETDYVRLASKLNEAEEAIFRRLQAMSLEKDSNPEMTALDDAIRSLRVLKRERLNFPDWH